jgi:putative Ca2+/H+ antiporter (TMEM165/GDT1 family)
MKLTAFLTIFATVFVAELGDKTQLATMLYATDARHGKWMVFGAAASALIVASALGVVAGAWLGQHVSPRIISWVAGTGFITIGVWTIVRA